jgi:uncharacterized protein YjbI with pentapeptide repeats
VGRCTELCTKETTGVCTLCAALAERNRFERQWFKGGIFIDRAHALQRHGVFILLHRFAFPLCFLVLGGLLHLWFAWGSAAPYFGYDNPVFVVVLVVGLGVPLLWLCLWWLPQWQVAAVSEDKDRIDLETKARQTMAQILGGAALLGGLYYTAQTQRISQEGLQVNQETLRTTQEGQITERFSKAIDQLGKSGKENLAVRLGGIYALERIARDSVKDHWPVMEVLTAFVREQTRAHKTTPNNSPPVSGESADQERERIAADIQAILTVLGRRARTFGNGESQPLNLSMAQLKEADFRDAQLQRANFTGAQLQGVNFMGAQLQNIFFRNAQLQGVNFAFTQLQEADFIGAQLQGADFERAQLQRADFLNAQLQNAFFRSAQLQGADFERAKLGGAQLQGVNFREVKNLTQDQIDLACTDENTKLPEGLTRPAPCLRSPYYP